MKRYVLHRVALAIPTLFLVSVIVLAMMRLMPGDVATRMPSLPQFVNILTGLYIFQRLFDPTNKKINLSHLLSLSSLFSRLTFYLFTLLADFRNCSFAIAKLLASTPS